MDSITHIALGAIIGEAVAGKRLGKRAMVIGAVAQSIPDIDFVQSFWLAPVDNLLAHRGFTHSVFFGLIVSVLCGLAATQWGRPTSISRSGWIRFFLLEIAVHLLLDSFNNYGIGWFEPFSHQRISFDVIFVADPFYSIWLGIGGVALITLRSSSPARLYWSSITLVVSSAYLVYALYNKSIVEKGVENLLAQHHVKYGRLLTTPAPFNNWLWYFAAESDTGFYVGYRSVFDSPGEGDLHYFARRAFLTQAVKDQEALGKLLRFSKGYYTVETRHDTLVFNDLRFGQVAGWTDPRARFAFHYYLNYPEANLLVVQRGRFENWNNKTIEGMIKRIRGK